MRKLLSTIDKICTAIAVLFFIMLVLVLLLNIVLRLFRGGISWYMETAQFFNVWSVFITAIALCATNDHLHIEAIEGVLHGTPKRIIRIIIGIAIVIFFIALGISFTILATRSRHAISTMTFLRMSFVYWPIPFLCFLSALSCTLKTVYDFISFDEKSENAGEVSAS
ncbi:MAG: TRAP transporter small permease subunit [Treponema sp.]|jgi:TRAP-type C4-dicarboxylate transport system permease small subunit|nr:TRAP transporter small permease subunit [Treponema sp.]